jgi:3-methylcrotonyl-CoA carboxylase alpha subunit
VPQVWIFPAPGLPLPLALAGLVAQLRAVQTAAETSDPWSRRDGWRLAGPATQFLRVAVGEGVHELQVQHSPSGALWLCVGGERHALQVQSQNHEQHQLSLAGRTVQLHTYAQGDKVHVFADAGSAVLRCLSSLAVVSHETQRGGLNAPMPGKLIALHVKPGDSVQAGQTVAVMEAMKMEHTLTAPRAGTVEALNYAVGDAVAEGAALLTLADSSA